MEKLKAGIAVSVVWMSLIALVIMGSNAYAKDRITMDVDSSVRSGTYICPSVKDCYELVLGAEARGATQWCNSVQIKRNGRVVWSKNYWPTQARHNNAYDFPMNVR